jgi:transmembrane sensor
MKDYPAFRTEEFVADDSFREWVIAPCTGSELFWSSFLERNPHQKPQVEEARMLVLALQVKEQEVSDDRLRISLQQLEQKLNFGTAEVTSAKTISLAPPRWVYQLAATLTLLAVGIGAWWFIAGPLAETRYQTAFGETRRILLPDQSTVVLNANSTLVIKRNWSDHVPREVWLEGEAFFQVQKRPGSGNARFTVHTTDLAVEVLGTSFNVKERAQGTQVVLNTGKVKLNLTQAPAKEEILMVPGEAVEYTRQSKQVVKREVNPEQLSAWKNNRIMLNNTPLREIAQIMEETYGVEVVFEDSTLAATVIDGTSLPTNNREAFVEALATTLNVQVIAENNSIIFKR